MNVSRRDFLKYCGMSATALGLTSTDLVKLDTLFAASGAPAVLWLQGSSCCGDSISLLNRIAETVPKTIDELLLGPIDLIFHPNVMGPSGSEAVAAIRSFDSYILVLEGGVPTAFDGNACIVWSENGRDVTYGEAIRSLAPNAIKVICVGQCACFGGIPASGKNPLELVSVPSYLGMETINIAGCPPHPDWMIGTIAQLLAGNAVPLDEYGRPLSIYGETVHSNCPRLGMEMATSFAQTDKCMMELGCRGPSTFAPCPYQKWNNSVSWCINANAPCIGCTEPTFPSAESFYSPLGLTSFKANGRGGRGGRDERDERD
jgi:hydrogenase small subunit